MTVFRSKNFVEVYRAKATAKDINELSGRTGRPDLTRFVASQIVDQLPVSADTVLVDIGCGEGSVLLAAAAKGLDSYRGRLIGILPTQEEVARLRTHLLQVETGNRHLVSIERGLADDTGLPDQYADIVVCNGVLLILSTLENVKRALREIHRITKPGATVYFGEQPDRDEMSGRNYGDSITSWLLWVLKNQGFKAFWIRLRQTIPAFFSSEPFVIVPKNMFHIPAAEFIELLRQSGFDIREHHRHKEMDATGGTYDSETRWDYVAVRR